MVVDGLPIPELLVEAINSGRWPSTKEEEARQNSRPLGSAERIRRFASIYLYSPPFSTVAKILQSNDRFYQLDCAIEQLVPELVIAIGDLGLGADAPILLDYRYDSTEPSVIYLHCPNKGGDKEWLELTPDFASFLEFLGM